MANSADISWKNRLQEYCQKNNIPLPNYRVREHINAPLVIKFQVEVEIDGRWYVSEGNCSTKKQAEQSAAKRAYADLCKDPITPNSPSEVHSETSANNANDPSKHLPAQFADVEKFIVNMVNARKGRIRKILPFHQTSLYKIEIAGDYRYCDNIDRHHKTNQVYFVVDPINKFYYQKCHDPDCKGFKSNKKPIILN